MKNRYVLAAVTLSSVAIMACSKSDDSSAAQLNNNQVLFGSVQSRVEAVESFSAGDQIYIASCGDVASVVAVGGEKLYTVTSANGVESSDPLYWVEEELSFYALNQSLSVNGDDPTLLNYDITTAQDELLWLSKLAQTRSDNVSTPIALAFERCLSEIEVNVTFLGLYASVAPELELYFNTNSSIAFNPWADSFAVESAWGKSESADYVAQWSMAEMASETQYTLMCLPQTIEAMSDIQLVVKDSEGDVVKSITSSATNIELSPGCRTKVNISIDKAGYTANVEIASVSVEEFEAADVADEDELIIPNHVE